MPLSFQLTIEEQSTYLHARATGSLTPENALRVLAEVHAACVKLGRSEVLLELALEGPSLDMASIFMVISRSSAEGRMLRRIAYVDTSTRPPEKAKFAETVAVNRGVNVRLFQDLESARQWMSVPLA
jgi:hypothetical protein